MLKAILLCTLLFWSTDQQHRINAAWIGLGAPLLVLIPLDFLWWRVLEVIGTGDLSPSLAGRAFKAGIKFSLVVAAD